MTLPRCFGAVLAGGASRRFGSLKALARVDGQTMLDRACAVLLALTPDVGVVTHLPALRAVSPVPTRADLRPGHGAIGGLHTALHWAAERGHALVVCISCDMPHLSPALLSALVDAADTSGAPAVAASGDRGMEPLCAVYSVCLLEEIEARMSRGELALHRLLAGVSAVPLGDKTMRHIGDPAVLLSNVNTRDDLTRAAERVRGQ
jgi:molybdopterin-guanine dinucleotide biosynthesis protein A